MSKGKAFVVVGHKRWGKSTTLRELSDGNDHVRWFRIKSRDFFVRRMSNDDRPESFFDWVNGLDPEFYQYVVMTLCPTFSNKRQSERLIRALSNFKRKYRLFFFVLRYDHRHKRKIEDHEIDVLERFGTVKIHVEIKADAEKRARALKRFITKFV